MNIFKLHKILSGPHIPILKRYEISSCFISISQINLSSVHHIGLPSYKLAFQQESAQICESNSKGHTISSTDLSGPAVHVIFMVKACQLKQDWLIFKKKWMTCQITVCCKAVMKWRSLSDTITPHASRKNKYHNIRWYI